jgi:hypothetical protein
MANVRHVTELWRSSDLTVIYGAFRARIPSVQPAEAGLAIIAELCRRDFAARPARNWHDVRDQLLLIAVEWDLARDRLDGQSDRCLRAIAEFLL